jgi:hypothetical protein
LYKKFFGHAQPDQLNWAFKMRYLVAVFILDELSVIINLIANWVQIVPKEVLWIFSILAFLTVISGLFFF